VPYITTSAKIINSVISIHISSNDSIPRWALYRVQSRIVEYEQARQRNNFPWSISPRPFRIVGQDAVRAATAPDPEGYL
jgi:hypothetical protein